jgi:hypothetical protein
MKYFILPPLYVCMVLINLTVNVLYVLSTVTGSVM